MKPARREIRVGAHGGGRRRPAPGRGAGPQKGSSAGREDARGGRRRAPGPEVRGPGRSPGPSRKRVAGGSAARSAPPSRKRPAGRGAAPSGPGPKSRAPAPRPHDARAERPLDAAAPSAKRLRELFQQCGLRLSDLQVQQFWTFHQLLRRRNDELDLTRLHAFDTIVLKHYVDSALVATRIDLPTPLLDLGSGAGFPGIPLKIVRPDVHILLGEPRHKRVAFLEEALRELGLRGIEVIPHRVGPRFDRRVRGVITRAVEPISETLARVSPWLERGAQVLFMKGPGATPEVEDALRDWSADFRVTRDEPYTIAGTPHARRLVVLERLTEPAPMATDVLEDAVEIAAPEDDFEARAAVEAADILTDDIDAARAALAGWEDSSGAGESWDVDDAPEDAGQPAPSRPSSRAPKRATAAPTPAPPHDASEAALVPTVPGREVRDIVSAANSTYKLLRAVLAGRGVRKHGQALLAGIRPILEVVRDHPDRARAWITSGATPAPPGTAPASLGWYRMTPALFREIDVFGTGSPLLLVDVPALAPWSDAEWPTGCTLFVPFQDPENVGAVVRTAAAFGVAQVVLLREAANPFHPRSARAAGSALLRVALRRGPSIHGFEPQGAPVYALSPGGPDVGSFEFPERFGLLVGLEGPGLPESWRARGSLGVPMRPGTESLNAAAATAIVLYLWSRTVR